MSNLLTSDQVQSLLSGENSELNRTILMFSGGRDSTLAAMRLVDKGYEPILVTVSSWHLIGIDSVRQRLREMRRHLPEKTIWINIRQPDNLGTDTSFYLRTCLPCHHAYVIVGAAVAAKAAADVLALGYVGYQNTWPEQTPLAVQHLTTILGVHGIGLVLPVYDISAKDQVIEELKRRELSIKALEQKCTRQVNNVELDPDHLRQQIALWDTAIRNSLDAISSIEIDVIEATTVSEL